MSIANYIKYSLCNQKQKKPCCLREKATRQSSRSSA